MADRSENYGGNTREEGYANMVDLGHMARQSGDMLPSAQAVLDALDSCVLYQVKGPYRSEATGLSCYYSYNGDADEAVSIVGDADRPDLRVAADRLGPCDRVDEAVACGADRVSGAAFLPSAPVDDAQGEQCACAPEGIADIVMRNGRLLQ